VHNWATDGTVQAVLPIPLTTIPNDVHSFDLQWSDPFNAPVGQYRIHLVDMRVSPPAPLSAAMLSVTSLNYFNSYIGSPVTAVHLADLETSVALPIGVVIEEISPGPPGTEIELFASPNVGGLGSVATHRDGIYGHPAVPGVLTVGAVNS